MDIVSISIAAVAALIMMAIILKMQNKTIEAPGSKQHGVIKDKTGLGGQSALQKGHAASGPLAGRDLSDAELEARVRELVAGRRAIEAIKLIREQRELGLREVKLIVDELNKGGSFNLPPGLANPNSSSAARIMPSQSQNSAYPERIFELLRKGKKIEAIKELREETGLGLKEAKDQIERMQKQL